MKILAVDSSSLVAAVAVIDGDTLLGEYSLNHKKTHSQKLMPMISQIMSDLELAPNDIDLYAAALGPGSFTGLRIGVTTVKAMAYGAKKPVVGVNTLDALAWNMAGTASVICPIMDARNNQVYTALYTWKNDKPERFTEYLGIHIDDLIGRLKELDSHVVLLGDGVRIHKEVIERNIGDKCGFAPSSLMLQRGASVACAALSAAASGKVQDCFELAPFYLRKSQAEREYERKSQASRAADTVEAKL